MSLNEFSGFTCNFVDNSLALTIKMSLKEIAEQYANTNDDRRREMLVAFTISFSLAIIAVILRFVSRRIIKAGLQADDYLVIAALVTLLSST